MSVLALGAAGAPPQSDIDTRALTASTRSKPTVIAARDQACPQGTVDKSGYCADGAAPPQKPAQSPPLLRSPSQQIESVIQSIQNLKYKCGPTQFWNAQVRACVEKD